MAKLYFKDKSGKVKYVATDNGKLLEVNKNGKLKDISPKESHTSKLPKDKK